MTSRRVFIVSVLLFVALAGVVLTLSPHNMRKIQAGFLGIISPFLKGGSTMEKKYRDFREGLKTLEQLEEENKRLIIANKDLSATNQTLRGLEVENNRLRNALGYSQRAIFKLVPGRIIARDASTWYNSVMIDRGKAEGLEEEMPVLTEEGLVGKVSTVSDHAAKVILIADETCRVASNVENSREQGIVKGERTSSNSVPLISLNFLSKQANLQPGQKVFTSGVGGVFPPGVLIGAVREYKVRELDSFATIVPAVDLTTLEDVFVMISYRK
ncbi:MAG: rod shape-determining protein MreC [Chthoniobacter sp.]|jgi:rod shape-determining protein MreC|nr:rod shape-determining protein MreC [Chthoniobacter sp.]